MRRKHFLEFSTEKVMLKGSFCVVIYVGVAHSRLYDVGLS